MGHEVLGDRAPGAIILILSGPYQPVFGEHHNYVVGPLEDIRQLQPLDKLQTLDENHGFDNSNRSSASVSNCHVAHLSTFSLLYSSDFYPPLTSLLFIDQSVMKKGKVKVLKFHIVTVEILHV